MELGADDVTGTPSDSERKAGQTRHIPESAGGLHPPPQTTKTALADARPVSRLGLVTRAWHLANAVTAWRRP